MNDNWPDVKIKKIPNNIFSNGVWFDGILRQKKNQAGFFCLFNCEFGVFFASYVEFRNNRNFIEFSIFKTDINSDEYEEMKNNSEANIAARTFFNQALFCIQNRKMGVESIKISIVLFINKLKDQGYVQ
jgi:hypothetical protein